MEEWTEVEIPTHPVNGGKWVEVEVVLRKNDSGEVRVWTMEEILLDGDLTPETGSWRWGNNSCDCNRRLFFFYAAVYGRAPRESDKCIGEGAYSVRLRNSKTGRVYYSEFEPE